jgi:hypothetical protein
LDARVPSLDAIHALQLEVLSGEILTDEVGGGFTRELGCALANDHPLFDSPEALITAPFGEVLSI